MSRENVIPGDPTLDGRDDSVPDNVGLPHGGGGGASPGSGDGGGGDRGRLVAAGVAVAVGAAAFLGGGDS